MDIVCPPSRNSSLARQKTRPPPLQIIPELSENELDNTTDSPGTARPSQAIPQQPESLSSRITLSAYTFSVDDALLMFGADTPRSPALSASSSTSEGASSDGVPTTPRTSDDEDAYDFMLPTPRFRPQRISIRPLCITKTNSLICQEDEDIHIHCEKEEKVVHLPVTEEMHKHSPEAKVAIEATNEAEQDFYNREFEDFISLFPATPAPTSPARRDSLIIVSEVLPTVIGVVEAKPRGRSRHSKPLPLLPPVTPPLSTFPSIATLPLVQTTAQKSIVRRKRNISSLADYPPSPPPVVARPLPRMSIPLDIDDCVFSEESLDIPSRESISVEQVCDVEENSSIYSQSSSYTVSASARPLPPAIPETPISGMYGDVILPRSSTDSDAPRSSTDSTPSFASSTSSDDPLSFPSSPSEDRLRSRWSTSTLGSLAAEPSRATTLLSPFKNVFNSRARRVPPPSQKMPPHVPKSKHCYTTTKALPSASGKHIRQQGSRSSTSSAGTNSSEADGRDGSPSSGLKRKPIPVAMFMRAT